MKTGIGEVLLVLLVCMCGFSVATYLYLQKPKFGRLPSGARLERIERSPHYANGQFSNLVPTPILTDGSNFVSILFKTTFGKKVEKLKPEFPLPSEKTDLKVLDRSIDTLVWLGHSSYFVQIGGKRILIDPVFSSNAAPVPFGNSAFAGTLVYSVADMPEIDYLLITHDHWDHLDYPTLKVIEPKIGKVICGLGVGADFEAWGYPEAKITEADWSDDLDFGDGLSIHVLPARHYSGRLVTKNKTLWVAYALEVSGKRIFFSGDSGYGSHFEKIGQRFDGFDLVVLDSGQYDKRWANIHMFPAQAAQAAVDLGAKALMPGHIGKFAIANHAWDEPFELVTNASQGKPYKLSMPKIGEATTIGVEKQSFHRWWRNEE